MNEKHVTKYLCGKPNSVLGKPTRKISTTLLLLEIIITSAFGCELNSQLLNAKY